MRERIVLLAVVIIAALFPSDVLQAGGGPTVLKKGRISGHVYGGSSRASNYFRADGYQRLFDSAGTNFSAVVFGLTLDYGLSQHLELNFDMPVGYFAVSSDSRFPDRSILSPTYFGLGATYGFLGSNEEKGLAASASTMLKIPPGFHSGIYDDPAHPTFLSDGYFQVTTSLNAGYTAENTWFKGRVGYNWRDEEPVDEILYGVEVGFTRVEGTGIFVGVNGALTTGDISTPARPFYAGASGSASEQDRIDGGTGRFSTIDRENYIDVNAGAFVTITDRFVVDGRYIIRLAGNNTLALRGAYIGLGYTIDTGEGERGEF